jgi:hypothetical protein
LAAAERPDHDRREDGSGGADHEPGRHHPVGQRGVGHVPLEVGERVVLVGELGPAGEAERVAQAEHGRPQDHQRAPPAAAGRRPERQRRVRRAAGSEQLHPGQQPVGTGNEPSTDRPSRAEGGRATRERVGIDGMPVLPGDEHGGSGDQPEAVDDGGAADQGVGVLQLVEAPPPSRNSRSTSPTRLRCVPRPNSATTAMTPRDTVAAVASAPNRRNGRRGV